jgi:hypothetical protein
MFMLDLPWMLLIVMDMLAVHVTTTVFYQTHSWIVEHEILEAGAVSFYL